MVTPCLLPISKEWKLFPSSLRCSPTLSSLLVTKCVFKTHKCWSKWCRPTPAIMLSSRNWLVLTWTRCKRIKWEMKTKRRMLLKLEKPLPKKCALKEKLKRKRRKRLKWVLRREQRFRVKKMQRQRNLKVTLPTKPATLNRPLDFTVKLLLLTEMSWLSTLT